MPQGLVGARSEGDCLADCEAPHWGWLARAFGLAPRPLVTAPYVWAQNAAQGRSAPGTWIAHCDLLHLALARDHLVAAGLGDAPVNELESRQLLDAARATVQGSRFRIETSGRYWFLMADADSVPDLQTLPLDAVLGQSLQERTPAGADARGWRVLENEIQMRWHASEVNVAREERGARTANAVWVHGAGTWQPVPNRPFARWLAEEDSLEARVLAGWTHAAQQGSVPSDVVSICRTLLPAFQSQAWESWIGLLPSVETQLQQELELAGRQGAAEFDLVLTGVHSARSFAIPRKSGRFRWPWNGRRDGRRALLDNLAETRWYEAREPRHA